ncbi:hypothetical protein D3C86_2012490 [compost metagenome]
MVFTVVPLISQGQGSVTPASVSSVKFAFVPVEEMSINPGPQAPSHVKNSLKVVKD